MIEKVSQKWRKKKVEEVAILNQSEEK